jgi:hypothetical protein
MDLQATLLRQRVMVNESQLKLSIDLWDKTMSQPVILGPVGSSADFTRETAPRRVRGRKDYVLSRKSYILMALTHELARKGARRDACHGAGFRDWAAPATVGQKN